MNTVSSLLSLQALALTEPLSMIALNDAKNRVQSMGVLYDKLYQSSDYSTVSIKEYITALVDDIICSFSDNDNVDKKIMIQDFVLDAKHLQPLGIILNELLTNIMKYAFKGRDRGLITVYATNSNRHVVISVKDDGLGMPESITFENSTGFGLQLVKALTQQLYGTIRIERGYGTKVVLEFDV